MPVNATDTAVTVKTNGQTLVVSIPCVAYTTAAMTSAVTFPNTITSDTTYYIPKHQSGSYAISVKQLDGAELYGKVEALYSGLRVIEPVPSAIQVAADTNIDPVGFGTAMNAHPFGNHQSGTMSTANRTFYTRIMGSAIGVTKVRYQTVTASGNMAWALYSNTGTGASAAPLTRLFTTDSMAVPSAAVVETTLCTATDITHGNFWLAFSVDNTTAAFILASSVNQTTPIYGWTTFENSQFPPPATATPASDANRALIARYPVAQLL